MGTANSLPDRYQLAGIDDRQRGFSRPVEFERDNERYRALLRYESIRVMTEPSPTQDVALLVLIQTLHAQGYRQIKTQMNFRSGAYLGSQEPWIEYPDPPPGRSSGPLAKIVNWFRQHAATGTP